MASGLCSRRRSLRREGCAAWYGVWTRARGQMSSYCAQYLKSVHCSIKVRSLFWHFEALAAIAAALPKLRARLKARNAPHCTVRERSPSHGKPILQVEFQGGPERLRAASKLCPGLCRVGRPRRDVPPAAQHWNSTAISVTWWMRTTGNIDVQGDLEQRTQDRRICLMPKT